MAGQPVSPGLITGSGDGESHLNLYYKPDKMKKTIVFQLIATVLFIWIVMAMPFKACGKSVPAVTGSEFPGVPADTTVTVTIVRIDQPTSSISLKDGSGKLWNFVVDPQLIDLKKYKVGQKVTATISTTYITDKVTRARISKMQLIKLQ